MPVIVAAADFGAEAVVADSDSDSDFDSGIGIGTRV